MEYEHDEYHNDKKNLLSYLLSNLISYPVYICISDKFIISPINRCFVTNAVAGLAGVVAPCLVCLMVVGIVFIQAFQITAQWQSYDDVFKGRYNINGRS